MFAFLRAGTSAFVDLASSATDDDSNGRSCRSDVGAVQLEMSTTVNGVKSDVLSMEGFASCLAFFPMLAFDWSSPVFSDDSTVFPCRLKEGSPFKYEDALGLFNRIDSDSDGRITAADLRLWRRMLPLGRSEDDFVRALLLPGAKAAAVKDTTTFSTFQEGAIAMQHQSKLLEPTERTEKELPGLRPWDFHEVLQDDPMLAAELCTQAAVLDFSAGGGHRDDYESRSRCMPTIKNIGAKWAVLPSESMTKACICVAKLKLCRLTSAYREVYAEEESMVSLVYRALDATGRGYIGAQDVLRYLRLNANIEKLSLNDVQCLVNDQANCSTVSNALSAESDVDTGQLLDQEALRQLLSRPNHRNF
jgi:hypothetical protein